MKEIATATFLLQFKQEVIQLQGFISFILLAYWVSTLGSTLLARLRSSRAEVLWFVLCLCFGLFMGLVCALDWGTEYSLIALSLGLSVGLAMTNATIAVCLFTSLLFLRPWELIESNDYFLILPKLTFGICAAHVLLIFAQKKSFAPFWSRPTLYLLLFAAWCFVTTFKSDDMFHAQRAYFETLFKGVFLYLMVTNALTTREDLRVLIGTVIITFASVGLVSIYQTHGLSDAQFGGEMRLLGIGAFSNSNDIAALMVLAFPFGLMLALRKDSSFIARAFAALAMGVAIYSIYLSQSRAAMLALAIALCLLFVLRIKNRMLTIAFCSLALLSVPAYMAKSSRDSSDLAESSSSRITYIKSGIVMGVKNPVLGVGFESYERNFERYATEILYEWGHRTAHNSWVLVFAETGFLGFFLFIALFCSAMGEAWRAFNAAPEFLLSLTGYAVAMSFLSHSYLLYPYLLYGLIGVASRVYPVGAPVSEAAPALSAIEIAPVPS